MNPFEKLLNQQKPQQTANSKQQLVTANSKQQHKSEPSSPLESLASTLDSLPANSFDNLFSGLESTLNNSNAQNVEPPKNSNSSEFLFDPNAAFENPKISDLSQFVFDDQPEGYSESTVQSCISLLQDLSNSLGEQIPHNLTRVESFIQEHPFLMDILKPESISILVTSMQKSYGHIVQNQVEKSGKKAAKTQQVNEAMSLIGDLQI